LSLSPFVHLRLHTAYSLSEGAIRIKEIPRLCRERGMPAVAITDTNNLFGGMEFSSTLAQAGIQPIIGCQLSVATDLLEDRSGSHRAKATDDAAGMVVLVQDSEGYGNLLTLLARAYGRDDPAVSPRVPLDSLVRHARGLILLTGGASGPLGCLLAAGKLDPARTLLERLRTAFGDRLYVELQRHGLDIEAATEPLFLDLAERAGLPIVATNEAFYPTQALFEAHDALICIAEGSHVADPERRRLTPEHFFKDGAQMRALFDDLPDAIDNTLEIAKRTAFMIEARKPILPPFSDGTGDGEEVILRRAAAAGLEKRLARQVLTQQMSAPETEDAVRRYRERLDYELSVICQMGFAGYFLIVAEFISWAKAQGIPVGPGRGSGAGSVVAWALTITDLDPLRFGLLFERFLNPERISMPDFDIDFCQDRRDEVIRHVEEAYGADRVAQIITFGKLQARAVLRDVGRVLGMAYGFVDRICKLVPNNPAHPVTLDQALESEPQLKAMAAEDDGVARLIDIARRLEGLYRHASTHAAGVVIGDRPLETLIPVYRDPRSAALVTGFNMKWVEAAGLVKFDFLGLKTLTVLAKAVELARRGGAQDLDLTEIPLDDARTYEMLGRGDTVGVFQLESAGMRDALRKLKPDKLEDIIAVVALYRPGPMDNIPSYIRRKHGQEEADYLHPSLEGILRETHGIMIYQEQVMQIAQTLSGYSLGGADLLRRAMGKKIQEEMDKQRDTFVRGARERGVDGPTAEHIFDLVSKFAGYGFNKSHAAAYALVAYQTAFMKAHYPMAFFAASMTLDLGNIDKLNLYKQELDRLRIPLLMPDINRSDVEFTVEWSDGGTEREASGIRYGLAAIKNVGEGAMAALVAERQRGGSFTGLADLARRLDGRQINKRQLENLIRAGALDSLNRNRRQTFEAAETLLRMAGAAASDQASGQMGLFAGGAAGPAPVPLPAVDDWTPMERLKAELEAVGYYLSSHPLTAYGSRLKRLGVTPFAQVLSRRRTGAVTLAGTVVGKKERTSGKGNRYAFLQVSDTSGVFEVTVFSELLNQQRDQFQVGASLLIAVNASTEGDTVRLVAQAIEPLDRAVGRLPASLEIAIGSVEPIPAIHDLLSRQGPGPGQFRLISTLHEDTEVEIALPLRRAIDPAIVDQLRALQGVLDVREG
jgi:DNA polymerase-3 subunit alpha